MTRGSSESTRGRRRGGGYSRMVGALCAGALALAGVLLVTLVAAVFANVAMGWLKWPTRPWLSQYATAAFAGLVYLCLGPALREGAHLALALFVRLLPEEWRRLIARMVAGVLALFLGVMVWVGAQLITFMWVAKLPGTGWPHSVYYIFIPVGGGLALLVAVEQLIWPPAERGQSMAVEPRRAE